MEKGTEKKGKNAFTSTRDARDCPAGRGPAAEGGQSFRSESLCAEPAGIHAQFAAKDATIADLQRQVTEQAARIAALQKQSAVPPAAAPGTDAPPAARCLLRRTRLFAFHSLRRRRR